MPEHQWHFIESGLLGETTVGPITESEFLARIRAGRFAPEWMVASPSRTNGQWFEMRHIPGCWQTWQQGEGERLQQKTREAERAAQEKQASAAQKALADQNRLAARERETAEIAPLSDSSNHSLVRTIRDDVQKLLTAHEQIDFICIQEKPVINVKPDAMVVTNRRLIFYRPKLLGRFDFTDYFWRDLSNAHLTQGILGSTFFAQHITGVVVQMDYLPKESATRLYRLAQQREEEAFHARRNMMMEERRAGASNIAIQNNLGEQFSRPVPPPPLPPPSQPTQNASNNLIQRLETLKAMLDKQLINQEEYERRKNEILSQV